MKKLKTIITLTAVASVISCSSVYARSIPLHFICPTPASLEKALQQHHFHNVLHEKNSGRSFYNYTTDPWVSKTKKLHDQIILESLEYKHFALGPNISASKATTITENEQDYIQMGPEAPIKSGGTEICLYQFKKTTSAQFTPPIVCKSGECSLTYDIVLTS